MTPGFYRTEQSVEWDGTFLWKLTAKNERFPNRMKRKWWGYDDALERIKADPAAAAAEYVRATDRCARCGKKLVKSIGYGPDCLALIAEELGEQGGELSMAVMRLLAEIPPALAVGRDGRPGRSRCGVMP